MKREPDGQTGTAAAHSKADRSAAATLTRSIYEQLRSDVLGGSLHPGEKLRIDALRLRFRSASSPIREALNRLLSEGFVTLEEQKGFRVAPVNIQDLAELVIARGLVDGTAMAESISRFEQPWEENLVLAFHRLSRIRRPQTERNLEWEKRHKALHMALIAGCGSRWIKQISEQLFDAADRYRLLSAPYAAAVDRQDDDEHRLIVQACLDRQTERAVELLKRHYRLTYELVENSLATRNSALAALGEQRHSPK